MISMTSDEAIGLFLIVCGIVLVVAIVIGIPMSFYYDNKKYKRAAEWVTAHGYDLGEVELFISCNDNWELSDFVKSSALKKAYAKFTDGEIPPIKNVRTSTVIVPMVIPPAH